ncbi:MAG: hypothetical protein HUJ94_07555 [Bacteroidales bacterium]|nr:hypothetical protein [Bacteroidales bacterium]
MKLSLRLSPSWQSASGRWKLDTRLEALSFRSAALMAYAGMALDMGKFRMSYRYAVFLVDEWDDRIYAYEHDSTGTFPVTSFYGRGIRNYVFFRYRAGRFSLDLRLAATNCTRGNIYEVKTQLAAGF